jgi:hypothetical protein
MREEEGRNRPLTFIDLRCTNSSPAHVHHANTSRSSTSHHFSPPNLIPQISIHVAIPLAEHGRPQPARSPLAYPLDGTCQCPSQEVKSSASLIGSFCGNVYAIEASGELTFGATRARR